MPHSAGRRLCLQRVARNAKESTWRTGLYAYVRLPRVYVAHYEWNSSTIHMTYIVAGIIHNNSNTNKTEMEPNTASYTAERASGPARWLMQERAVRHEQPLARTARTQSAIHPDALV